MKNLKISQKLVVSFSIVIGLFGGATIWVLVQLNSLHSLQDDSVKRANDAVIISEASGMANKLYSVFADAIINRDLEQNQREWEPVKEETIADLELVAAIVDHDDEVEALNKAKVILFELFDAYDEVIEELSKPEVDMERIIFIDEDADKHKEEASAELVFVMECLLEELAESQEIYQARHNLIIKLMLIISLIVVSVTVFFILMLVRLIAVPIKESVDFANLIAQGDLTKSISIDQKDEVGKLAESLNKMNASIKEVASSVIGGMASITSASEQLSSTSQQLSQGASEQASSVEEVSSTMEEIAANIEQNTENSQQTETISKKANDGIQLVAERAGKAVEANKDIADKITIINDIAFQTNILALNAAVEAARAGEQGKGFAVVAAEVRKLAERSKTAAEEIVGLAQNSLNLAQGAGEVMMETIPQIENTTKLVQEISAASIEQNNGASQVNNAIQQLNNVTQQNAAASEELATSAEELSGQAQSIRQVASFFNIGGGNSSSHTKINEVKPKVTPLKSKTIQKEELVKIQLEPRGSDSDFENF